MTSHDERGRGFLLLGTGDEQRCRLESGNEQGRSKSSLRAGIGRFMNRKGTEKPLTEVEGRRTLDGSLMKGLSFRTGASEPGIKSCGSCTTGRGLLSPHSKGLHSIEFMGRMLCGRKVSEGVKVNTDIEHTGSD